jgi:hypothetical protein
MIPNPGLRFRGFNGSVVGSCRCEVDFSCVSAVPISYDKSCYTQLVTYCGIGCHAHKTRQKEHLQN